MSLTFFCSFFNTNVRKILIKAKICVIMNIKEKEGDIMKEKTKNKRIATITRPLRFIGFLGIKKDEIPNGWTVVKTEK